MDTFSPTLALEIMDDFIPICRQYVDVFFGITFFASRVMFIRLSKELSAALDIKLMVKSHGRLVLLG